MICLDEGLGGRLLAILRMTNAPRHADVRDLPGLDLAGTKDDELMRRLGAQGFEALVTRDSRILNTPRRRAAWRQSGLRIFICDPRWGNLPLFGLARSMLWCWPAIVERLDPALTDRAWLVGAQTAVPQIHAGAWPAP